MEAPLSLKRSLMLGGVLSLFASSVCIAQKHDKTKKPTQKKVEVLAAVAPQENTQTLVPLTEAFGVSANKALPSNISYRPIDTKSSQKSCAPAVTLADLSGQLEFTSAVYSLQEAVQAKLPFVHAGGNGNSMVLVRDYRRAVPCDANDGTSVLVYGQVIRTIITIENYDANIGSDYVAAAANATLKHSAAKINIVVQGFDNPAFTRIISPLSGQDLNVETLPVYRKVMSDLLAAVSEASTTQSVKLIGELPSSVSQDRIQDAPTMVYALAAIKDGQNCEVAKTHAPRQMQSRLAVIAQTFTSVMGGCTDDDPGGSAKSRAEGLLAGLKVRL